MNYGMSTGAVQTISTRPNSIEVPRDTITSRLHQTAGLLEEIEGRLYKIGEHLSPLPTKDARASGGGPMGLAGLTMEMHAKAERISESLRWIENALI